MPHFSFLPESELEKITAAVIEIKQSKGTVIAVKGETRIENIFIVTKGSLSLHDEKKGEWKLTGYIKTGEVFGGITILMNSGISLRTVMDETD